MASRDQHLPSVR
ncbi:hypothetical protein LINPERHAP1_LOCUS34434 [Linum perenne]